MERLKAVLDSIAPLDHRIDAKVRARLDQLTKPRGSLGRLEDLVVQFCSIRGTVDPRIDRKMIFTFAGDHGVAAEGVSAYPKAVTPQMVRNMLAGGAAVNVLARHVGAQIRVVDIGVDDPLEEASGLVCRKIRRGTGNIAEGPAMTMEEALRAIHVGIDLAQEAREEGMSLIGLGEMGIANTTPSAALYAALLPAPAEEVTGRGTGIDDDTLSRKLSAVKRALTVNRERLTDGLHALAAVGGLEIAGITGVILGAASCRIPAVVDGFISTAGALVACRMCEPVRDYLFFSHCSEEAGHKAFFRLFGIEPLLDLRMRLGEGTGAALAMSLIEAAVKIYNEMATFGAAGVSEKSGL